ncbi:hypothetical protein DFP93_101413 [Aneurinibacillus soli]|uniref:Uncharacterized protein n=1 Tax=Aneurinibacillus soli TaxID=1500254 RepID=A0A0U5BC82_9BACL|nr:non-ribosomal peptide synthetase module [Aneurinibacillus soli]PYE64384.1 hypothetical protein DFP93_101413 [Aneurinibacillus soli]BAU28333.1 hypothetical protein CB4_02507 [Aneurinibacillus soli]
MAQRVATEYKKLVLELSTLQLQSFVGMFDHAEFSTQVRIFENGETEVVLLDKGMELPLSFKRIGHDTYTCEGQYKIYDAKLANQMRMAVRKFKGCGIVHRLYPTYTMVYEYTGGHVMRIMEQKDGQERLVFEYKDTLGDMQRLFEACGVEDRIDWTRLHIDQLLDLRNQRITDGLSTEDVDHQLTELSQQLFMMEA